MGKIPPYSFVLLAVVRTSRGQQWAPAASAPVRPRRHRQAVRLGCTLAWLAIPIKAVLLPVLCPALLQRFDLGLRGNTEAAKGQYKCSN